MSKFDATRYQILRLNCTKFDFRWGSDPDPAGVAYSAPPDLPIPVFKWPTSKRREEVEGREEKEKEKGRGREKRKEDGSNVKLLPTRLDHEPLMDAKRFRQHRRKRARTRK